MSEKDEIDMEVVEQLKASVKLRGPIEKVVLDASGKLVDGHQRKAADPNWPEEVNPNLKTEEDGVLFEIDKNWHRTSKSADWKHRRIMRLAELGNNAKQIVEKTGLKLSTVYLYLPAEYKNKAMQELGVQGGVISAASRLGANLTSQDIKYAECEWCGVSTAEPKPFHRHQFCPKCFGYAENHGAEVDGKFRTLTKEKNGQMPKPLKLPESTWSKSRWEDRKSNMQVPMSKGEIELGEALAEDDLLRPITHQTFPLGPSTTPDYFLPAHNLAVYYDGPPHDNPKQKDRDEELRNLLVEWHPMVKVCVVTYKMTRKEQLEKIRSMI